MKVATWNIAGGRTFLGRHPEASEYGYGKENLRYFSQVLQKIQPDIVCLQEVHSPIAGGVSQGYGIARDLNSYMTQPVVYSDSHIQKDQKLSLATLSKTPFKNDYFFELPHVDLAITRPNGDEWISFRPTGFHVTEVDNEGEKVTVINTHLHPFHYFEKSFADPEFGEYRSAITEFLLRFSDTPTIIAGDFNYADLQKLLSDVFTHGQFQTAFSRSTTPEKGQQDHILFSKHWKLAHADVHMGSADHYVCTAELQRTE